MVAAMVGTEESVNARLRTANTEYIHLVICSPHKFSCSDNTANWTILPSSGMHSFD
jgi:hypothetical protein